MYIYFQIQLTEKYSTAMCYAVKCSGKCAGTGREVPRASGINQTYNSSKLGESKSTKYRRNFF